MKLAICTDVFGDLSFTEMLDKVKSLGINAVEMTAGGWGGCKHVPTQELLSDDSKRKDYKAELDKRGMEIAAFNCSGNQLCPGEMGQQHTKTIYDTAVLAGKVFQQELLEIKHQTGLHQRYPGRIIWWKVSATSGKT